MRQEAVAYADTRVQAARGAADRFATLLEQKRRDPERTRNEIFLSVVDRVLPRTQLVVLPTGETPRIDVNLYRTPAAGPVLPEKTPGENPQP
jgi:hypothetical protein